MKKVLAFIFLFFLIFTFNHVDIKAQDNELISGAKSGILIEQSTGTILYEKNIDTKLSPASMTKIMSLLLIYEAMENNQFNKETILTTSEYAASMGGSQVYLKEGEKISVDECLKCICIASANDCAVLMAETVAGSEAQFVNLMNKRAKELGLNNTNFLDCTGLESKNHYTTAYDLAIISKELLTKYPQITEYTCLKEDYIRNDTASPFWLVNTNKMIGRVEGLNGLKTGYTSFSGYCITLSMSLNNMDLISVVFGYDNALKRNTESLELLRYGFSNYKIDTIIPKDTILDSYDHILYKNKIELVVDKDITYLCKRSDNNSYTYDYTYNVNINNGNISVYLNNQLVSENSFKSKEALDKKNLFEVVLSIIKKSFT